MRAWESYPSACALNCGQQSTSVDQRCIQDLAAAAPVQISALSALPGKGRYEEQNSNFNLGIGPILSCRGLRFNAKAQRFALLRTCS